MKRILPLLLTLLIAALPLHSALGFTAEEAAALDETLNRDFTKYSAMGACVILFENGEVSYVYTTGVQKLGGDPITPGCGFRVGSISKMVSCIGLMKLVEEGKCSLDDDLSDLLGFPVRNPDYPETPITLRQLLTHTAGFAEPFLYTKATRGEALPLPRAFSGGQLETAFLPGARPGHMREYSNFGGGMLGVIIERLSGEDLDAYMRRILFDPLDIDAAYQTGLMPKDVPLCNIYHMPGKTLGRELSHDEPVDTTTDPYLHYNRTAGSLTITPEGLAKIMIMLCEGGIYGDVRILKASSVKEMCTLQNYRGSVQCDSGQGLFMNIITDYQVEGRTLYGHGGKAYGMLCAAYFDPLDRTGVIMLTNGCNNNSMYYGVGMAGRVVLSHVYDALEMSGYEAVSPYTILD